MGIERIGDGQLLNDPAHTEGELNKLSPRMTWQHFDDFNVQSITEAVSGYVFNKGTDDLAVDPAIVAGAQGLLRLTAGDGDGTFAVDGSQVVLAIPVKASYGGLAFECRLAITDISEVSCYVGFTDITTLEEPMSVSGTTLTTTASDGVGFVYDSAMTTAAWWMAGVAGDTDATGSGTLVTAPADAAYQTLRCEIGSDGSTADFYINGTLKGSLTADVCTAATAMYFTVALNGDGSNTVAQLADIDYILVEHTRT